MSDHPLPEYLKRAEVATLLQLSTSAINNLVHPRKDGDFQLNETVGCRIPKTEIVRLLEECRRPSFDGPVTDDLLHWGAFVDIRGATQILNYSEWKIRALERTGKLEGFTPTKKLLLTRRSVDKLTLPRAANG